MGFEFTSLNDCEMCGQSLPASDDTCECADRPNVEMVFRHIESNERRSVTVSEQCEPGFVWEELADDVSDPMEWALLGPTSKVNRVTTPFEEQRVWRLFTEYQGDDDIATLRDG